MKRKEDLEIDDLKNKVNEEEGKFIDAKVATMLTLIKQYRPDEDYWFVKYYEVPSFSIFAMGAMACEMTGMQLIYEPGKEINEDLKTKVLEGIEIFADDAIWKLFNERHELAVCLFLFGAYQRYQDFQNGI